MNATNHEVRQLLRAKLLLLREKGHDAQAVARIDSRLAELFKTDK